MDLAALGTCLPPAGCSSSSHDSSHAATYAVGACSHHPAVRACNRLGELITRWKSTWVGDTKPDVDCTASSGPTQT
eukprot:365442-Chlamydomonas_euryale.AAC.20